MQQEEIAEAGWCFSSIVVEPYIWHQVGMDLISLSLRENKYIMTLTDYFSKWAEAAALPDKCAVGVAK